MPKSYLVSEDKNTKHIVSTELPLEVSKLLDSLDIVWEDGETKEAYPIEEVNRQIASLLKLPALLMECKEDEAINIISAIEWCFNSYTSENTTMSFLQICIALEALLGGDTSELPLTKTLADRCAYLISNDIRRRTDIKKDFMNLYEVRSKLVHGVITPESNHKEYLRKGRYMLEFAIIQEIKNLNLKAPTEALLVPLPKLALFSEVAEINS